MCSSTLTQYTVIELLSLEIVEVALLEVAGEECEFGFTAHVRLEPGQAAGIGLDPDHQISRCHQLAGHGPDAGADLENAAADKRPEQAEYVIAIATRLLDDLEIVGGVLVLRLVEPAIDVRAVAHRINRTTVAG